MRRFYGVCSLIILLAGCDQPTTFDSRPLTLREEAPALEEKVSEKLEVSINKPPTVSITKAPQDQFEGSSKAEVIYEVTPGSQPIAKTKCYMDREPVRCGLDGGVISVAQLKTGDHEVQIFVEDKAGLKAQSQALWTIYGQFTPVATSIVVPVEEKQSDILFVIDNSKSMKEEQKEIADKIISFMENLEDLNWQIAIVTTDPDSKNLYGDGKILQYPNGSWILTPSLNIEEVKKEFTQTITRKESGSSYERGIRAVYRSIERAFAPKEMADDQARRFFRDSASLSVVLISDEDESLKFRRKEALDLPEQEKSDGKKLVELIKEKWPKGKLFQFHSIITRPKDDKCLRPHGEGYGYGHLYAQLSKETGGLIGDICSKDYGSELKLIGQEVAKLSTIYELGCAPQDTNSDGVVNFSVHSMNGQTVPRFKVEKAKITFEEPLSVGRYEFTYSCMNKKED